MSAEGLNNIVYAQDSLKGVKDTMKADDNEPEQVDIKDLIRKLFKSKKKKSDTVSVVDLEKGASFSILPGISYNPANDVIFGVNISIARYYGSPKNTTISSAVTSFAYTTKNQVKISVQSNIFTKGNEWTLKGDWRFWIYSQETYGLGTGTSIDNPQNMKFKLIKIEENVLKKVVKNFYAGLGYNLEYYFKIKTLDEDDNPVYPNYHNTYSRKHGIDSTEYLSSGFIIDVNFDSRDNSINAYKGIMMDLQYRNYNKVLGSSTNWQAVNFELRAFQPVLKDNSFRVALWLMGKFILNGRVPYMSLNATGWDKYNSSARGYVQGRYRGRDFFYAEFENRFDITQNGLIGAVVFINASSISDPDSDTELFKYLAPAFGIGLRVKFDKQTRTNLCVDYARGKGKSSGIFLSIGEFF